MTAVVIVLTLASVAAMALRRIFEKDKLKSFLQT